MTALLDAQDDFGVALGCNKLEAEKAEVRQFIERGATGCPPPEVVEAISALWKSEPIQVICKIIGEWSHLKNNHTKLHLRVSTSGAKSSS